MSDIGSVPPPFVPASDPPDSEAPPASEPPAEPPAAEDAAPEHGFKTVDDAVAALKETRSEAASRRIEAKEAKDQLVKYNDSLAGYKPEEIDFLLELFHDLSDPKAQKKAAKELADISAKVLEAEGPPTRPTGEEDPDEKPLTKKEWQRLQGEHDKEQSTAVALRQLEADATEKGYPPDSPGYTVLLGAMMEPEVAGDLDKAVARVKEYEAKIVESYRSEVEANGERWPGAAASAPATPGDPDAGVKPGWTNARNAAAEYIRARAGKA